MRWIVYIKGAINEDYLYKESKQIKENYLYGSLYAASNRDFAEFYSDVYSKYNLKNIKFKHQ